LRFQGRKRFHNADESMAEIVAKPLVERFDADAALRDALVALAACERRADFSRPCGAPRGSSSTWSGRGSSS
jgi:ethanolamine utilization microcompartment shell protein EutL